MSDLPSGSGEDWPAQAADTIVRVVGRVRDKTTGPAITIARGIVFGLLALVVGAVAVVLLAVMAVRFLDVYIPEKWTGDDNTWAAHLLVGLVFVALGGIMFRLRRPRPDDA
jgi:hypothetical protein